MNSHRICCIVPAKDEAVVIAATLTSLLEAGMHPHDIYLVDDFSSDGTGDIGRELGVTVLRNEPNLGKAHAIARAVDHFELDTRYEFIALMDADTRVNDVYFAEMLSGFADEKVVVTCGRPKSRPFNWLTAYRAYSYGYTHMVYRKGQSNMGVINVAPGCSTVYRATIWRELDWSKDTIVEDMDVTIQIHKKKLGVIRYVPRAIVHTQDPQTIPDYTKQMLRWNTGTWQVVKKHKLYRLRDKIDWECMFLYGEGVLFSMMYLIMPLLMLLDYRFAFAAVIDVVFALMFAAAVATMEKRKDIIMYALAFPFIRIFDASCFVRGFWKVIIRRQAMTSWFTPKRYAQK
ncbi:hypothetical protein A3C87_00110 [Candidatus Kaiserbacteria bacterium RIFCSPHIGHO2_02_FULL_49_34]|uniref:Glycosyltransferase 2-like domain-containing protein n=1 Tax=Candidatus Kaiserbacteria bacterium RIFCSPHIGHO2_02_FULL_49_34 TaxID=1798491 RepID=A0A1F6DJ72_9BACT|nr:MAG: hypothetical protein A3C87_00110 [Candidatus Kaiserbacteria bacterium RIFCSPHIGHO2_02_FULL_49_34]